MDLTALTKDLKDSKTQQALSWSNFLDRLLSRNGQTRKLLTKIHTLKQVLDLQEIAELLLHFSGPRQHGPFDQCAVSISDAIAQLPK